MLSLILPAESSIGRRQEEWSISYLPSSPVGSWGSTFYLSDGFTQGYQPHALGAHPNCRTADVEPCFAYQPNYPRTLVTPSPPFLALPYPYFLAGQQQALTQQLGEVQRRLEATVVAHSSTTDPQQQVLDLAAQLAEASTPSALSLGLTTPPVLSLGLATPRTVPPPRVHTRWPSCTP